MKKPSAREVQTTSDAEESNASEDNSSSDGDARASASESEEGNAHEEHEPGGTPQAAAMQRKARAAPNKGKTRRNGAQNRPVQATQKVEKQLAGDSAQPTKQSTSGSEGDSSEAEGEDHDATSAEFDEDAKVEADVTGGSEWTPPLEQKLEAFFQQLEKAFDKKLDAFFEKQKTQMNNLEASVQKLEESVNSFENSSHEHRAQLKRVHDEVAALKQDRHQLAPSLVPDEQKKRKKSRKCT